MTPKMRAALAAMVTLSERYDGQPVSPNEIGRAMGQPSGGQTGRPAQGYGHTRRTGPGSGIVSVLRGLEQRGLITWDTRRDGLSGTAYVLTDLGADVAAGRAPEPPAPARQTEAPPPVRQRKTPTDSNTNRL